MIKKIQALYQQTANNSSKEVVGFFCCYVPVEIIEAAGFRPVRLAGIGSGIAEDEGMDLVGPEACSFCKEAIGLKLLDKYPYNSFKKLIVPTTCDQMRRQGEVWEKELGVDLFFLNVPSTWGRSIVLFKNEIRNLAEWLGADEKLLQSSINRANNLRKRMLSLRQRLTAREFHLLVHLWFVSDFDFFEQALPQIEDEASGTEISDDKIRLLLAGGPLAVEDSLIFDIFEKAGVHIIDDTLCTGRRECDFNIKEDDDFLGAIAEGYFERPPCIWRRPNTRFFSYIKEIAQRQRIDGIVFKTLKYCDVWNIESRRIKDELKVPMLTLETTYGESSLAQVEARAEAFVEMLKNGKCNARD
jgi:benzoyl-CoA reductase/2-hydroxyglutaryl-CoA dehydratase subunit BcrC/BadD/HgdB